MQKNAFLHSTIFMTKYVSSIGWYYFENPLHKASCQIFQSDLRQTQFFFDILVKQNTVFRETYYDDKVSLKWFWLPQKWINTGIDALTIR